jgi:hypothetical protein
MNNDCVSWVVLVGSAWATHPFFDQEFSAFPKKIAQLRFRKVDGFFTTDLV